MFQGQLISHQINYQGHLLKLETGLLARQASASVLAQIGETTVLATCVVGKPIGADYFPLQVVYEEKMYASGKIKGSRFIKREGKPTDNAILTGRMIDRSLRSLFNSKIRNEVQIVITVLSLDEVNPPDTLSVLAASSCLNLARIKAENKKFEFVNEKNIFKGPVSAVRIGLKQKNLGQIWFEELQESLLLSTDFEKLEPVLHKISQTLYSNQEEDKKWIKKIFELLKTIDKEYPDKFLKIYKQYKVATQASILMEEEDQYKSDSDLLIRLEKAEIESKYTPSKEYLINPNYKDLEESELDLVVSGDGENIMMVEAGAKIISEEQIAKALDLASEELLKLNKFQQEFITKALEKLPFKESFVSLEIADSSFATYWLQHKTELEKALYYPGTKEDRTLEMNRVKDKHYLALGELRDFLKKNNIESLEQARTFLVTHTKDPVHSSVSKLEGYQELTLEIGQNLLDLTEEKGLIILEKAETELRKALDEVCKSIIQTKILEEEKRVDGRNIDEIRPINCQIDVLPRVHGSSLFQRGETQVLNILTLGTLRDAQAMDDMEDFQEDTKRYLHHYNFPAFSVGETGRYGAPGRREIGHGSLAEKALLPVLPSEDDFPYTIRLVSECLGSNGSTSMASTCASSLSLMAAGVPISKMVAGIAMGLVIDSKSQRFKVLTDIQGLEDHYGDMDFKVTGSEDGITAIQLDNKVAGLTTNILKQALLEAKKGRLYILAKMHSLIQTPKNEISSHAPTVIKIYIPADKIGDVIGPNGKVIKSIVQKHEVEIDIEDITGKTFIYGKDKSKALKAKELVLRIAKGYEVGEVVSGRVYRIEKFGAFVKLLDSDGEETGREGMAHISKLSDKRIEKVEDIIYNGDEATFEVIEVNEKGQINLKLLDK